MARISFEEILQIAGISQEQFDQSPATFQDKLRQLSERDFPETLGGRTDKENIESDARSIGQTLPAVLSQLGPRVEGQAAFAEQQATLEGEFLPFKEAGTSALQRQQELLGLFGPEAREAAVAELRATPEETRRREEAFLGIARGAGATGQRRGGQVLRELQRTDRGLEEEAIDRRVGEFGRLAQQGLSATGTSGAFSTGLLGDRVGLDIETGDIGALGILGQQQLQGQLRQQLDAGRTSRFGDFVSGALELGSQVAPLVSPAIQGANFFSQQQA